jgi:dTDP-L-rhamnose 4-epimerase
VTKKILITGGAGFIGSHLVDNLLSAGHDITVLDDLEPQVHGNSGQIPEYLAKNIHFIKGDIRNKQLVKETLKDIEVIYHLAAMVGIGQSMYQVDKYTDINMTGTARLLDILVNEPNSVKKLVVASSNTVYGEGSYKCEHCGTVNPLLRTKSQLDNEDWELHCPICKKVVVPIPTTEEKPFYSTSIYALGKEVEEKQCLMIGKTYGIDTTALRFFLVYGSRQALSNPYTGVCAIFSNSLLNGNPPIIYEDGNQSRDFVHVKDICQALILSMEKKAAAYETFNVGTGQQITISQVAETLANHINPNIKPVVTNKYRPGDIRHCFPDISKIQKKLGFKPQIMFKEGIKEVIEWVKVQKSVEDKSKQANEELKKKGLL